MTLEKLLTEAQDTMLAKRVFGEPVHEDGITVIPAAKIRGGGGGGTGADQAWGGGFGVMAAPAGALVIREGQVSWKPAIDVNRAILVAGIAAVVLFLMSPAIARAASRHR